MVEAEKQILVNQMECCSALDYEGGIENLKREIESVCNILFHFIWTHIEICESYVSSSLIREIHSRSRNTKSSNFYSVYVTLIIQVGFDYID